jgi:hypothetical protein
LFKPEGTQHNQETKLKDDLGPSYSVYYSYDCQKPNPSNYLAKYDFNQTKILIYAFDNNLERISHFKE